MRVDQFPRGPIVDRDGVPTRVFLAWAQRLFAYLGGGTDRIGEASPAGVIQAYAGATTPTGWLSCDGSAVNRTTYAALFAAIGTTYGVGDGSTTFNLPDLRGRAVFGVGTGVGLTARALGDSGGEEDHVLTAAELAAHTHVVTDGGHTHAFTGVAHSHTVTDPGHTHSVTDTGHTHTVTDGGHTHAITDPGHTHGEAAAANFVNDAAGAEYLNAGGDKGTVSAATASATTGVTVDSGTTGVTVDSGTTGITNASATTGATVDTETAGGSNASAATGITLASAGSDSAHNTMPPFMALNWMIKT